MLAIVDNEQQFLALERGRQGVNGGGRTAQAHTEGLGDDGSDQLGVLQRSELGEPHPVRIAIKELVAGFDCEPRLADAAGAGQGHQSVRGKLRRDVVELGFPADQSGRLLRQVVAGGADGGGHRRQRARRQRRRGRHRTLACHRRHETVAPSRHGEQIALAVAGSCQQLTQRRDVDLDIVLLHHHPRPNLGHQLVLGHQLAAMADQGQQNVESALAERDRHAMRQQLAPRDQQPEWSEPENVGHRRHRDEVGAACASTNRKVSRLRPSRRS